MANKSVFPSTIEFDGAIWHLVYDPSCEATVLPNVNERDVQRMSCDMVKFPGRDKPVWLVTVFISIPSKMDSSGNLIGGRRMLGFRTFDRQPSPYRVQPNELVYYVAEQSDGSAAQRFFNAITRANAQQVAQASKPDTSWCKQFSEVEEVADEAPREDN